MCILSAAFCFVHTCLLKEVQEINVTHLCLIVLSWIAVLGSGDVSLDSIYVFISWFGHLSSWLGFKLKFWRCCWFEVREDGGCGDLCGRRRSGHHSEHLLFPQDIRNPRIFHSSLFWEGQELQECSHLLTSGCLLRLSPEMSRAADLTLPPLLIYLWGI